LLTIGRTSALARLGIKALVLEGLPADPKKRYLLELTTGGERLVEAGDLAGKGLEDTFAWLARKYPGQAYAGVGPAGETGLGASSVARVSRPSSWMTPAAPACP